MAEIWEVRCRYRLLNTEPEECAENTHTFLFPLGMPSLEGLRDAMAQSWAPIVHLMHIDVMWEGIIVRRMEPSITGAIHLRFDEPIPGQVGGVVLPTSSAVEVLRDTPAYGRSNRGKWWLPWLTGEIIDLVPHNQITDDGAAAIGGAISSFSFLINGHNAAGITAIPVVYSRRSLAGGTHWNPVTGYRVMRNLRALAKRGRRTGACPPFPNDNFFTGGMSLSSCLEKWGNSSNFAHNHSLWKYQNLSLGNGLGNMPEPDGWNQPGFDASSWTDRAQSYTPSPPVLVPTDYATTHCVPGPSHRYGIDYPAFWTEPPGSSTVWNDHAADFQLPHWVTGPTDPSDARRIPRDGHVLLRTEFKPSFDGELLTCAIDFCAIDSVCIWFNGELVVEQLDGEWSYPMFPIWQTIALPLDPEVTTQTLAILVRSHHTPPGPLDACTDPDQNWSWRVWHIYGDCLLYDPLCLHSVFATPWDQFQRAYAFLGFRLRAEWIEPDALSVDLSRGEVEIGVE